MTLTIGSLFSGIGGIDIGLERAGMGPVSWQAESDAFCRSVLAKHWPKATRYEDVRAIDEQAQRVDVVCGGFPCQDISQAGKGAGLVGERSGLWSEFARVVREIRPHFVVVENVAALLARGFGDVLGDLAACGYDAQWDCIPAAAVGAPHRRDRVFLVAWRVSNSGSVRGGEQSERGEQKPPIRFNPDAFNLGKALANANSERWSSERYNEARRPKPVGRELVRGFEALADTDGKRLQLQRDAQRPVYGDAYGRDLPQWPPASSDMQSWGRVQADTQPAFCRMADGLPFRLDQRRPRLKSLGNAVVPQVAQVVGSAILEACA